MPSRESSFSPGLAGHVLSLSRNRNIGRRTVAMIRLSGRYQSYQIQYRRALIAHPHLHKGYQGAKDTRTLPFRFAFVP